MVAGKTFFLSRSLSSSRLRLLACECKHTHKTVNWAVRFCCVASLRFPSIRGRRFLLISRVCEWTVSSAGRRSQSRSHNSATSETMFDQQSQPNDRSKFLGQLLAAREERDRERRLNTAATSIQVNWICC